MRADLGHQKYFLTPILDGLSHSGFALAIVVFPRVVEERHTCVDCLVDEFRRLSFRADDADMIATQTERRNRVAVLAELTPWDFACAHLSKLCKRETINSSTLSTDEKRSKAIEI
jgi:hypothetical protein